jgi:hypothetical protein
MKTIYFRLIGTFHTHSFQTSYIKHKPVTNARLLIPYCLKLHPLLVDTPTSPQIEWFQLPNSTGTKIKIILWFSSDNINFRALRKLLCALYI